MALRLAQLPLVFDCPRFEPVSAEDATTCARCREVVHDLSAFTESEVRRFLTRHAGRPVCVSVRVDRSGSLVLRDAPWPSLAGLGLIVLLAAAGCAGMHDGLESQQTECHGVRDDASSEPAPPPLFSGEPGLTPRSQEVSSSTGCPVRYTGASAPGAFIRIPSTAFLDVPLGGDGVVRGMVVTPSLAGRAQGHIGTRQGLPDAATRRERRCALRRLRRL